MPTNTTDTLREHQRKAGSVKSEAKAKAARENGKKGGWPKGVPRKPKPLDSRSPHVKKLYDTGRIKPSAPDELDMTPPRTTPDEYSQEMPDYEAGS